MSVDLIFTVTVLFQAIIEFQYHRQSYVGLPGLLILVESKWKPISNFLTSKIGALYMCMPMHSYFRKLWRLFYVSFFRVWFIVHCG